VGGTVTYARGLLGAYVGGAGPERVTVLGSPAAAPGLPAGGPVRVVPVAGVPLGPARGVRLAGLLRGIARAPAPARALAAEADLVHFPLTVPVPRAPRPPVLTLFDVLHHDVPDLFSRAERAFRRVAYEQPARRAARVVTVSEHSRRRIAAVLGIDAARIVAIHPGLDHERFSPGPVDGDAERVAAFALPEPPWLLYPAALWPHKNHAALLNALPDDTSLVLTGATFGRERELQAHASAAGVADRLRILGQVPSDALPALYRAATGVVFPSLAEGFGQPPLEAMACGCPVAASDTGAVAEACGDAALTFPPRVTRAMAAAITRLTRDEALRAELRAAGTERARAFNWERAAARHAEVYAAVLSSR
jgi:glycosyltransferase involved in cell wall biosynthesis